jgi:hypothetical protein
MAMFVFKSVFLHFKQWIMTFVLSLFVIWVYTLILITNYSNSWRDRSFEVCSGLETCFLFILNHGIRAEGGISDLMQVYPPTDKRYVSRFFYDLIFYFMVKVIIL